jgi:transcription-repair coupling factor (superfamily II helicase)
VLTEAEFYGRTIGADSRVVKKLASRRRNVVDPLQLKAGDIVVHATHGIGRFVELVQREVSSGGRNAVKTTREYLVLEYAPSKRGHPGDKLFVPTDQLDLLSKYVGGEAPTLSKMGGSDWAAAKGKARKAVRDIAVELVKLYSARMAAKGYAFGPDTPWQRELEEAFPFAETPDQLQTIDEIKADMERPIPMDRLLGRRRLRQDRGRGACRVQGDPGRQAGRHARADDAARQAAPRDVHRAVRRLSREGASALAVPVRQGGARDRRGPSGRHRRHGDRHAPHPHREGDLQGSRPHDHRRGAALRRRAQGCAEEAQDERRHPRDERDPDPAHARDGGHRHPRDVDAADAARGPASDPLLRRSAQRQADRRGDPSRAPARGQVFYVHNRVQSIQRVAAQLAELVPEARIAVAHGQMGEHALEEVVDGFWERRFDVLVSTTIIETGLDISNANTIIIDRADKYGLSQLHQLRGRVGRGRSAPTPTSSTTR